MTRARHLRAQSTQKRGRVLGALLSLFAWLLILAGAAILNPVFSNAIFFAPSTSVGAGYLVLGTTHDISSPTPIKAGESVYLQIKVELNNADQSDLRLDFQSTGELSQGLHQLQVQSWYCLQEFDAPSTLRSCGGAPATAVMTTKNVETATNQASLKLWDLPDLHSTQPIYLLMQLSLPADRTVATGDSAVIGIGFHASYSDSTTPAPPPSLARTGVAAPEVLPFALSMIGIGSVLLLLSVFVNRKRAAEGGEQR